MNKVLPVSVININNITEINTDIKALTNNGEKNELLS